MKVHLRYVWSNAWDLYPTNKKLSPDGWYGYVTSLEELRWMVEQQIKEQQEEEQRNEDTMHTT